MLLIHDSGDIMIGISRIFAETNCKITTVVAFHIALIIFTYTRVLIFPYVIYVSTIKIPVFAVSPYL